MPWEKKIGTGLYIQTDSQFFPFSYFAFLCLGKFLLLLLHSVCYWPILKCFEVIHMQMSPWT